MANEYPQRNAPPIPFLTAVWAGMSHEDIVAGLRNGDIVRPGRLPEWAAELDRPFDANDSAGQETASSVDRARVASWFTSMDSELSTARFDAIWNKAGASDEARARNLTSRLYASLLRHDPGNGDSLGARAVELDAYLARGHHAKVVDLAGKTGNELASLAATDAGYRYAIENLDCFAITGITDPVADTRGPSSRSQGDGATSASDAWLADRGKFLAWKLAQESDASIAVSGNQEWTFFDRGIKGADGKPLRLEIRSGAENAGHNQVIFGTADDEVFKGVAGSDRIYAGAGDDVLRGGAGGDHLEGGEGDDLAIGGSGNDELRGGRGDDELDGGRGDDALDGGAGNDTYVIDAGDGADTIVDSDGVGSIELNGEALTGTMRGTDGKWTSADDNVEFTFTGDLATGGSLMISSYATGASHDGPAQNTVTVNDWKNGDLGITLDGDPTNDATEAPPVDTGANATNGQTSSSDLNADAWGDQDALSLDGSGAVTGAEAPLGATQVEDDAFARAPSYAGGEGPIEAQWDFDAAWASLIGATEQTFRPIDQASYDEAIKAFSGVLEPPDISNIGHLAGSSDVSGVTEAAMADALAGDYASDAFDGFESEHAPMLSRADASSLMEMKQAGMEVRSRIAT